MNLSKTDITNPPTFADADIQGHLDAVHAGCATGWISSSAHPGLTLEVEVLVDDAVVAREMADSFRPALEDAGIGNGNHDFRIDRKSVVEGKRVLERVDLGDRRLIKKIKTYN